MCAEPTESYDARRAPQWVQNEAAAWLEAPQDGHATTPPTAGAGTATPTAGPDTATPTPGAPPGAGSTPKTSALERCRMMSAKRALTCSGDSAGWSRINCFSSSWCSLRRDLCRNRPQSARCPISTSGTLSVPTKLAEAGREAARRPTPQKLSQTVVVSFEFRPRALSERRESEPASSDYPARAPRRGRDPPSTHSTLGPSRASEGASTRTLGTARSATSSNCAVSQHSSPAAPPTSASSAIAPARRPPI